MSPKEEYLEFVRTEEVPLFFKDFWWDALNSSWDVAMVEQEGVKAWMPWFYERHYGFKLIRNPRLTPYSGILFNKKCSIETKKAIWKSMLKILPRVAQIDVDLFPFNHSIESEQTKSTHFLDLSADIESIQKNFKSSLNRQLRKAAKSLVVSESKELQVLFDMYSKTFEKRGQKKFLKLEWMRPIWETSQKHQCGKLIVAQDGEANMHAALWIAHDKNHAYYLLGGSDPQHLGSGAMGLLLWTAIREAKERGNSIFDFEGSEIEGIARFFKTFGAEEKKISVIKKDFSSSFRFLQKIKSRL